MEICTEKTEANSKRWYMLVNSSKYRNLKDPFVFIAYFYLNQALHSE